MKEFYEKLIRERKSYSDMIAFCCDSLIMNNNIYAALQGNGYYFDPYCGTDYDEKTDEYTEIYQWYIIDESAAYRLSKYTNEIVYYCEDLDIYLLAVSHWGTPWVGVEANWKTVEEMED